MKGNITMKRFLEWIEENYKLESGEACRILNRISNRVGVSKTEESAIDDILLSIYKNRNFVKSKGKRATIEKFIKDIKNEY